MVFDLTQEEFELFYKALIEEEDLRNPENVFRKMKQLDSSFCRPLEII